MKVIESLANGESLYNLSSKLLKALEEAKVEIKKEILKEPNNV